MLCSALISEANDEFSSQYQGELATHLPMALVALEKIGASLNRLIEYRDNYVKRLEPHASHDDFEITRQNWKEFLGLNQYQRGYIQYFQACLEAAGIDQVLHDHLPDLFRGVAGGAFHGIIRLGYALETQNIEEIGQALGYWSISFLKLEAQTGDSKLTKHSLGEVFSGLNETFAGFRPKAPNIARRMEIIGQIPDFQRIIEQVDPSQVSYETLAPIALDLFYQTEDFTALHAVTALHAFRLVSKYLEDKKVAAHCLFVAIAAAYVSIRAPKIEYIERIPAEVSWRALMQTAIDSNDDHVPKIVYSCREEFAYHRNSLYFAAALKYVSKLT